MTTTIKRQHLRDIRSSNRARILQVLREPNPISRQELAERLELTPATMSRISKELIEDGICEEAPLVRSETQRGRPGVALRISAKGGFLVAISISSFSRMITVIDIAGNLHHQQAIPKHVTATGKDTVDFVGKFIDQLIFDNVLDRRLILGAVMTIPGSINVRSGFLTKSILLNWPNFAIQERLSERLKCHVRVENNGDALCRHFMDMNLAQREQHSSVFLAHISEGMGASIAIGGRIVRRLADEGWINDIKTPQNETCDQQDRKLSDLASGRAILNGLVGSQSNIAKNGVEFPQMLEVAVEASNQGSDSTRAQFFNAGFQLGRNLVPLTIAIAPEVIVLAGPVLQAQAYAEGASAGYNKAANEMDILPSRITVSKASYSDASGNLALHDFLLTGAYGV
ncbi:MAG: ROK family protein [Tateyamaria sp.]|uniref:ROK family transcriptional regulator n=1 Tax=Tateyamaria sp. TaxID=1929288 RepID=UPI00329B4E1B